MNPLSKAAKIVGSRAALARDLGVTGESVRKWELRRPPAERCLAIERATGGQVTRYDLRPDIFGPAPGVDPELPAPSDAKQDAA